jgi:hypothetical protein
MYRCWRSSIPPQLTKEVLPPDADLVSEPAGNGALLTVRRPPPICPSQEGRHLTGGFFPPELSLDNLY